MPNSVSLSTFSFQDSPVRSILIDDEPWFVAADVCKILDHSDVSMAVSRLDDDEKLIQTMLVSGQHRNMLCVNESGLYHLIFTSRKVEAQAFRKWVTSEVLPAIRKTGIYGGMYGCVLVPQDDIFEMREQIVQLQRAYRHVHNRLCGASCSQRLPRADFSDQIVFYLSRYGEMTVRQLCQRCHMPAEEVCKQTASLVARGIVSCRQERARNGKHMFFYALIQP